MLLKIPAKSMAQPAPDVTKSGVASVDKALKVAGYAYDNKQDIYYSVMDAWQRDYGYCRMYDEACPPLHMIIDCEPIYFYYNKKNWLIEFWKGQYGMTSGAEIGVYMTSMFDISIPGVFHGTWYKCVNNWNRLKMEYTLKKNGVPLFHRKDRHWWLTGFKLGEFSQPWELSMDIKITLKNQEMLEAFLKGLRKAGYKDVYVEGNSVSLVFDKPKTKQPVTRTKLGDKWSQKCNKQLCEWYKDVTKNVVGSRNKLAALQTNAPELYDRVFNLGKGRALFEKFDSLLEYLH